MFTIWSKLNYFTKPKLFKQVSKIGEILIVPNNVTQLHINKFELSLITIKFKTNDGVYRGLTILEPYFYSTNAKFNFS